MAAPALPEDPVVGIIGVGTVGEVMRRWFAEARVPRTVALYDKFTGVGSVAELDKADVVFVCVPTPHSDDGGFDDSAVVESLSLLTGDAIVAIRSTVLPGSVDRYQERFPGLRIVSNPEFLRARHAWADFVEPALQLVGAHDPAVGRAILALLPPARHSRVVAPSEAEMVKLFLNVFLSVKLTLANEIYDVCAALGIDYDAVRSTAGLDDRLHPSHLDVAQGLEEFGRRGYSGACLPKDVQSFIDLAESLGVPVDLVAITQTVNERLGRA